MTPPRNQSAANALRMIPTKWAVVLVGIAIAYVVLQPQLNQWFGWSLPSVAALNGDEKAAKKEAKTATKTPTKEATPERKPAPPTKTDPQPQEDTSDNESDPLYGFLQEVGRNRYESPAGLVYAPGSEEGHRLKHIARHLEDQPNRPGSHGVFKGGMKQFLTTIDQAYARAKAGDKGTTMSDDDGSMVYEVTFDKAIGFVGGEAGRRKKNPAAKKLKLVVRGSNVITAFPF